MTIKAAKAAAIAINGRLPRRGYEVLVDEGLKQDTLTNEWDGKKISGRFPYKVYLVNRAGRYSVRTWQSVTPA
jgi:hypothetical protein